MLEDLASAVQMLAADNARLCSRLIAAEKALNLARRAAAATGTDKFAATQALRRALEDYDASAPS